MASKSSLGGPDDEERKAPGDTSTNPTGVSSDKPAKGPDDEAAGDADSPEAE
ncbi:MAG: hypothetical protein V4808_01665 [Pseudomonadota bacterium]